MPKKREVLVKSNALVRAQYKLSAYEHVIVMQALADGYARGGITGSEIYLVDAHAIAKNSGYSVDAVTKSLLRAAKSLRRRDVTFTEDVEGKHVEVGASWVQTVRHTKGEPVLYVRFNEDIVPYLSNLKNRFSVISIADGVFSFQSGYSYRFIELFSQMLAFGKVTLTVYKLRTMFSLEDSYKAAKDFRVRVIDTAIDEINAKTQWKVSYEIVKKGKRIDAYTFKFRPPKAVLDRVNKVGNRQVTSGDVKRDGGKVGETESQVKQRIRSDRVKKLKERMTTSGVHYE